MKWWEKMKRSVAEPEVNKRLKDWKTKYENAKLKYGPVLEDMRLYDKYYNGDHAIYRANGEEARKKAKSVWNISYELIESQVSSSIPMPKVTPVHEEDMRLARKIEQYLIQEVTKLDLKGTNDLAERTTPIQGSSFMLVEWDANKGTHCVSGDLSVENIDTEQLIPQPGVNKLESMDYFFIRTSQTKEYVKKRWHKDVSDEDETDKDIREEVESDDVVTVITAYFRNSENGIGIYRWCGDVELEYLEDYEARYLEVCDKCGEQLVDGVCPVCGGKKTKRIKDENDSITIYQQTTVETMGGTEAVEEKGIAIQLPYYKPSEYPVVVRKNISKKKSFLGSSDIDVIQDQAEEVKKLNTKIDEKLLKAGSYITLPDNIGVETTDEELKIIRINNPAEKALIDVITAQADTTQDRLFMQTCYDHAKSALGITDAFQGKYDPSATSGTAKQYSINQAAGRLESKRVMKNRAFADLYKKMFKLALAYADQPIPVNIPGEGGSVTFDHFDKADFVKYDADGVPYWNDEFYFDIDETSTLQTDRAAMWNQNDIKLQSGAFGPLGDLWTIHLYWTEQARSCYPNAGEILRQIDEKIKKQEEEKALMMQQAQQAQLGVNNEMPIM